MGFLKRNWFYLLTGILLLLNLVLGIYNFTSVRSEKGKSSKEKLPPSDESFYNSPAPDFAKDSVDGKRIRLSSLKGNVIILRFSRFYLEELPYLLYLEHLAKRFKEYGVSLIFINSLGKHYKESIEKFVHLDSPVIEDDGSISSSFKSNPYETVIIGRDFKIKFKYGMFDKRTIYNQFIRFAFEDKSPPVLKDDEIESLIKSLSFKDVRSGKIKRIGDFVRGKSTVLNLFISTCMGCPEGRRISLLKEVGKLSGSKGEVLILFGKGNGSEMIRDWAERIGIDESISIGVIEGSDFDDDYLKVFRFEIDPRIFIFDREGKIVYSEEEGDERFISPEFLMERMR